MWGMLHGGPSGARNSSKSTDGVPPKDRDAQLSEAFFLRGPLCAFSYLYGWGSPPLSMPGSRAQSWLFMPLISLGLLGTEDRFGLVPWSIGNRAKVGADQASFWHREAPDTIQAYGEWFGEVYSDRSRHAPVWVIISDPSRWGSNRDHLGGPEQEAVTPSRVSGLLASLLPRFAEWSPSTTSGQVSSRSASTPAQRGVRDVRASRDTGVSRGLPQLPQLPRCPAPESDGELRNRIVEAMKKHPLPPNWKAVTNRGGEVYYWNKATTATTWTHPFADTTDELLTATKDCLAVGSSLAQGSAVNSRARADRLSVWAKHWHDFACRELARWRSVDQGHGLQTYFYRVSDDPANGNDPMTTWEDPRIIQDLQLRFKVGILSSIMALPAPEIAVPRDGGAINFPATGAVASGTGVGQAQRSSLPTYNSAQQSHAKTGVGRYLLESGPASTSAAAAGFGTSSPSTSSPLRHSLIGNADRRSSSRGVVTTPHSAQQNASRATRRSKDGQLFGVDPLPADHSCGFHGLGISREDAAFLLTAHRGDPEVMEFVAADLQSTLFCTTEKSRLPPAIREDDRLWEALGAYYAAQQEMDSRRRQARDLLGDGGGGPEAATAAIEAAGGDTLEALQLLLQALKAEAKHAPSGSSKLRLMNQIMHCNGEVKALTDAVKANDGADSDLRRLCCGRFDAYVEWIGSDMSFWLSFVRSLGGERTGGLLDAIAKVKGLTVRVWSEAMNEGDPPPLELVHEAPFGGHEVDLWYQGHRGHFDRLIRM